MDSRTTGAEAPDLIALARRYWRLLTTPAVPDYQPTPAAAPADGRLRELERVLDLLEATRRRVVERGWLGGGWMIAETATSAATRATGPRGQASVTAATSGSASAARRLLRHPSEAGAACLIGTMLLLADDQDTAHSIADVWRATDALYESIHERAGHLGYPPGHLYGMRDRRGHVQVLTAWNDEPGRSAGDVVDVLNRSISRTIAACVA